MWGCMGLSCWGKCAPAVQGFIQLGAGTSAQNCWDRPGGSVEVWSVPGEVTCREGGGETAKGRDDASSQTQPRCYHRHHSFC